MTGIFLPRSVILKSYSLALNASLSPRMVYHILHTIIMNIALNTSHSVNRRLSQHSPGINQKFWNVSTGCMCWSNAPWHTHENLVFHVHGPLIYYGLE